MGGQRGSLLEKRRLSNELIYDMSESFSRAADQHGHMQIV